jgi:hypothetical protein
MDVIVAARVMARRDAFSESAEASLVESGDSISTGSDSRSAACMMWHSTRRLVRRDDSRRTTVG